MTSKELIDECRARFNAGSSKGFFSFLKSKSNRDWNRDCGSDEIKPELIKHYKLLHEHGRVVWGCIAQANNGLFGRGSRDLPANTVFSEDAKFDSDTDELRHIAGKIFSVKDTNPANRELAQMAAIITDEFNRALNNPIPKSLTGGEKVYFTTTHIHRKRLPTGYLTDGLFPLLVCPRKTPWNMVLPLVYWAPALVTQWQQVDSKLRASGALESETALSEQIISPEVFAANPIRLTDATANEIRLILKQQGMPKNSVLNVLLTVEGRSFMYNLDIVDPPPNPAHRHRCVSQGIQIVVPDAKAARYLMGVTIDFRHSSQGKGFVFQNPNQL